MKIQTYYLLAVLLMAATISHAVEFTSYSQALKEGEGYLRVRQIKEARAAFEAAIGMAENDSERIPALMNLGDTMYYAGQYPEARTFYQEVLETPRITGDQRFYALQFTGHAFMQEGLFADALAAYRESESGSRPTLSRNARNDVAFAYRDAVLKGMHLYRINQPEAAKTALLNALDMEGLPVRQRAQTWLTLGHVHAMQNNQDDALAAYRKTIDENDPAPDYWLQSEALLALAGINAEAGAHDKAQQYLLKVVKLGDHAHPRHLREAIQELQKAGVELPERRTVYGAEMNPTGSPIGGGEGYAEIFSAGDYEVANLEELTAAMEELSGMEPEQRAGKVVYLKPGTEINLTGQAGIRIPSGVILAGNRGENGARGAVIYCEESLRGSMIAMSADSRLTGLRLHGDGPTFAELFSMWPHNYFTAAIRKELGIRSTSTTAIYCGDRTRIDNCEIARFSRGISTHNAWNVRVQHNIMEDISPYPFVSGAGTVNPLIEANIIYWAWHGLATSDHMTASYTVRYNIIREASPNLLGQGISGCFAIDHHGQGDYFVIHHNTFEHMDPENSVPGRAIALAPVWDIARTYANRFVDYMTADDATYWMMQRPAKDMTDLRDIVTRRDLSPHLEAYINAIEDFEEFDMREIVAMSRGGYGGENLWFFDNAYGTENDVLDVSIFTTPRIFLYQPAHRKRRTDAVAGRGGGTLPAMHHLKGIVPLDMEVEVIPPLEIKEVVVELFTPDMQRVNVRAYNPLSVEPELLYAGDKVPVPGEITLDTTTRANGIYVLRVTAGDSRGIRAHHITFFEIVN